MSRDPYEQVTTAVVAKPPAGDSPHAVDLAVAAALAQKELASLSRSPARNGTPLQESRHSNIPQTVPADPVISRSDTIGSSKSKKKRTDENGNSKSFADRAANSSRTRTPAVPLVKGDDHLMRDIDRALPGDPPLLRSRRKSHLSMSSDTNGGGGGGGSGDRNSRDCSGGGGGGVTRKRSQFFEEAFSARDGNSNVAKERVRGDALVLAEVRTNVIVNDEFSLITELSSSLAVRYRRPLQSIVVTLQHNACMCFGGSFEPAYVMAVFALPSEVQPATNKRNAALIQRHMEEALGVPAARGFLKFEAVPEANLAYGGKTAAGYMEEAGRLSISEDQPNGTTNGDEGGKGHRRQKASRKMSVKSLSSFRSPSPPPTDVAVIDATTISMDEKMAMPMSATPSSPQQSMKSQVPPLPPLPTTIPAPISQVPPVPPLPPLPYMPAISERSSKGSSREKGTAAVDAKEALRVERKKRSSTYSTHSTYGRIQSHVHKAGVETEIMGPDALSQEKSRRVRRTRSFVATLFGRSGSKEVAV